MVDASVERVAHRGGSHLAPENTMGAFRHALTMPINAIELDVQMSRDGTAVVFHDGTVERVTDGEGNVLDADFAYLHTLNAAARFPAQWPKCEHIPTLRDVLALARNRVRVYIEIKASERDGVYGRYPRIVETVLREVRAVGMLNQVLLISFDWSALQEAKRLEPMVSTGALVSAKTWDHQAENAWAELITQVKELDCEWVNIEYTLCTEATVPRLHQANLKLGVWTVNTLDALQRFARAGVDSLTTDRPDLFAKL